MISANVSQVGFGIHNNNSPKKNGWNYPSHFICLQKPPSHATTFHSLLFHLHSSKKKIKCLTRNMPPISIQKKSYTSIIPPQIAWKGIKKSSEFSRHFFGPPRVVSTAHIFRISQLSESTCIGNSHHRSHRRSAPGWSDWSTWDEPPTGGMVDISFCNIDIGSLMWIGHIFNSWGKLWKTLGRKKMGSYFRDLLLSAFFLFEDL